MRRFDMRKNKKDLWSELAESTVDEDVQKLESEMTSIEETTTNESPKAEFEKINFIPIETESLEKEQPVFEPAVEKLEELIKINQDVSMPIQPTLEPGEIEAVQQQTEEEGPSNESTIDVTLLQAMKLQIDNIEKNVVNQRFTEQNQQQLIDSLHSELQFYKNNGKQDQLLPFVRDVISLIGKLEKQTRAFATLEESIVIKRLTNEFHVIVEDLEDILYRQGIDAVTVKIGDSFDPTLHKIITKRITHDKALERTVAEVMSKAYMWDSRIIQKAQIVPYVYEEAKNEGGNT